ncbi:hypothetical protein D3C84_1106230 [compost metagenome]|jgi:hypothetical protein|uniref:hypothetical protein n=1 Tax=Pseudomonas sp. PDM29 TaxID=2854771 RepID=UPI000FC2E101|nr:hypothetical protein [Pseudomonas sp. PDM29]MBV7523460.1 hypothetical protein [Pseudomonas sp. PDM29]
MQLDPPHQSSLTLDQRLSALEIAASTIATAHTNAIASVVSAICKLPEVDARQLESDLTELKTLPTEGVDPILYGNLIDLFISRIEHARK